MNNSNFRFRLITFCIGVIVALVLIIVGFPFLFEEQPLPDSPLAEPQKTHMIKPHWSDGEMIIECGPEEIWHNHWLPVELWSEEPFTVTAFIDFRIVDFDDTRQSYTIGFFDEPCEGEYARFVYNWRFAQNHHYQGMVTEQVRLRTVLTSTATVRAEDTGDVWDPDSQPFYLRQDGSIISATDWVDWRQFEWMGVYRIYLPLILSK